jgi:hypothetical protein
MRRAHIRIRRSFMSAILSFAPIAVESPPNRK